MRRNRSRRNRRQRQLQGIGKRRRIIRREKRAEEIARRMAGMPIVDSWGVDPADPSGDTIRYSIRFNAPFMTADGVIHR